VPKAWGEVDKLVMENASVVPLLYRKNLLLRPTSATNVTVTQSYSAWYDYLLMAPPSSSGPLGEETEGR